MESIPNPPPPVNPDPPRYLAETGAEAFAWGDTLDALLSEVRAVTDPGTGEDVAVWALRPHARLVAVVRPWGEIVSLAGRPDPAAAS
jgi:hypothetical protein